MNDSMDKFELFKKQYTELEDEIIKAKDEFRESDRFNIMIAAAFHAAFEDMCNRKSRISYEDMARTVALLALNVAGACCTADGDKPIPLSKSMEFVLFAVNIMAAECVKNFESGGDMMIAVPKDKDFDFRQMMKETGRRGE
jgi:hypothetical protein